jgi:uncharacterized protein (DUF433 family)
VSKEQIYAALAFAVVNPQPFARIATLSLYADLDESMEKQITAALAFAVVKTPEPFAQLTNLYLRVDTDVAELILPHLDQ